MGKISHGVKLVVVESPTKAKTIRKFLGKDFVVESCMGHIRDLPQSSKDIPEKVKKQKWAQLGVNVEKNFEPLYCIPKDKIKVVKTLKEKMSEADEIFLATDEDREGESISWHLLEVLKPEVPTRRMVFHEITKDAIEKALHDTREINQNLVKAQEARRILDRLVGYTISPLLWKKVAYGLSAGRVQSVAVRLIVEKEHDRIRFKKSGYWGLSADLSRDGQHFEGKLSVLKGKKIATGKDFDGRTGKLLANKDSDIVILMKEEAFKLKEQVAAIPWVVRSIERKPVQRKPHPPFITSTLQQESNRKLGLSSRETMQVAQKLYEQGYITYMRTDSTYLSNEAIEASRSAIKKMYGTDYLPLQPRTYQAKKVKGAQEAHEAIRPAGNVFQLPEETGLAGAQFSLYDLIWKRTMASQMVDSRQLQVSVKIQAGADCDFSANGMTIEFPGYLRAYVEGSDDPEAELEDREVRLPPMESGQTLNCHFIEPTSHETKPPARYTEASLVQIMEKEGIGRPSTYASVIGTIIDRGYIRKESNNLVPTFTAMVVSNLLSQYLPQYVDIGFTSEMENSLDKIADGEMDWTKYLDSIYNGKSGLKATVESQESLIDPDSARTVQLEGFNNYKFKVGRFGAYLSTIRDGKEISVSLPESESPASLTHEIAEKLVDQKINGADSLGKDPNSKLPVYVLTGRFGPYVQLGDITEENDKPKRVSLPTGLDPSSVNLSMALELLSLPKTLGEHPISNKPIKAGLGRFGPYVVCDGDFRSIPKTESVFSIDLGRAVELLNQPKKGRGKSAPLKEFGAHPATGANVQLLNGPYGYYLKSGKLNASIPEGQGIENLDEATVFSILSARLEDLGEDIKSSAKAKKAVKPNKAKSTDSPNLEKKAIKKSRSKVERPATKSEEKAKLLGVKKVITRRKNSPNK